MSKLTLRAVGGTTQQRQMCRDLVRFALPYLMKQSQIDKLSIRINIKKDYVAKEGCYGICDVNDVEKRGRPKSFSLSVDGSMLIRHILTTVAHELVHVKQYATGELVYRNSTGESYWHGEKIDDNLNYWLHPWEIEAAGWERNLVELWIEHTYGKKELKWMKELHYHGEQYWRSRGNKIVERETKKLEAIT